MLDLYKIQKTTLESLKKNFYRKMQLEVNDDEN